MNNLENIDTEEYFETKDIQKLLDKEAFEKYTGDEFDELDLTAEHIENAFTNKKYYQAMKDLPLIEKKILYYSIVVCYPLSQISKILKIDTKEVEKIKAQALHDFRLNLKNGSDFYAK